MVAVFETFVERKLILALKTIIECPEILFRIIGLLLCCAIGSGI